MFTWIPIHEEAARATLERSTQLLPLLHDMESAGLTIISLQDKTEDGHSQPICDVDPFTFFASFNRGIKDSNRRDNWAFVKDRWQLTAPVPDDFDGIPVVHNMQSWFFPWAFNRNADHIPMLQRLAARAVAARVAADIDVELLEACAKLPVVGLGKLTIGLFWLNPTTFLPADKKTVSYGIGKGIDEVPEDSRSYLAWVGRMSSSLGQNYAQISHDAHLAAIDGGSHGQVDDAAGTSAPPGRQYWVLGAGTGGKLWESFRQEGVATIGFDGTPDLRQFKSLEEIRKHLRELKDDTSKKNAALACWQFVHDVQIGDVLFAKQGMSRVFGYGIVTSEYRFEASRPSHKHVRSVEWLSAGDWGLPTDSRMALKTLTNITEYADVVETIAGVVGLRLDEPPPVPKRTAPDRTAGTSYWWLNANPKIWDLESAPVGTVQTYTSHNEKGNKRQRFRYFEEITPGDILVGYVTSPQREIVAICRITKGLHKSDRGEAIEFEKVEALQQPVPYATLQEAPDLAESEPMRSNQGSLFRLTEREFEAIRSLIDETDITPTEEIRPYSKRNAMDGLFLSEAVFDDMLTALREKKNIVLQGAPGVGKTFVAKRLAYAFIGSDDPQRVQLIQFHQSYSYEDFVQGFRPTAKGHFELTPGLFYRFCRRAQRHEAEGIPHVLIIDEINRGNLSKIFGELMMLVEADKRGRSFSMPLAYAQDADDTFFVPSNLYLIGMMNTADRSLAMVDYALRRRFRFISLRPEFGSDRFTQWLTQAGADKGLINRIVERMGILNDAISADTKNLGAGYQIGHSYFCPLDGVTPDEAWYRRIIESEIVPLLQEYWFDDDQKVQERRAALLA